MEISCTDRVRNEEVVSVKKRGISYKHKKEGRLTGLATSCVGTAL